MLTVLLATKNRAALLQQVLESFCGLKTPAGGWKLVVVDNGSTDPTAQTLASFSGRLPLHSVFEAKRGKNYALNAGLARIEGDLTVMTDDDVFPHADWLVELRKAADTQPEYTMFGGAIVPRWEVPPPEWISWIADPGPVYTLTFPSQKNGPIEPYMVFGPNYAVRNSVFAQGMRFDPAIGPSGASYAMGSETEFLMRLGRAGHKAYFVSEAVVEHFIRKEQIDKSWVLERAVRWGRGRFRMSLSQKLWFGLPRHLFRDMPKEALNVAAAWMTFRQPALFRARWRYNTLRGMATEARTMARESCSAPQTVEASRQAH